MDAMRPDEVFLDREQEGLVVRDLGQTALRGVVQLRVVLELVEEAVQPTGLGERGHPQEDPSRLGILRDGLEGLEVS